MQSIILSGLALAGAVFAGPTVEKRALPVGQLITSCTVPGTVAMTFDDGPYIYTAQAVDLLNQAGMKATFFLNGANWGSIYDYGTLVNQMRTDGHQVGSHTYVSGVGAVCKLFNSKSLLTDTYSAGLTLTSESRMLPPSLLR